MFWENRADCQPNNSVFFWRFSLLLGGYNVAVSLNCKIGTTWLQMIFVGASANSNDSMLGLKNVKNVVVKITLYVSFVQKHLLYSFVKWIKYAQTGSLFFDRHQLSIVSNFCKKNLSVKTMRISNFNDNIFNQSESNISLWVIRYEAMV